MTKTEMKRIIKEDITPRYEASRDSVISFVTAKAEEYRALKEEMRNTDQSIRVPMKFNDGEEYMGKEENPRWRELYTSLYGYYDKEAKKQRQGTIYDGVAKQYQEMMHTTDKEIVKHYTAKYKAIIKELIEAICEEIKQHSPKSIEAGRSEHDINFLLTMKDGSKRSYTINTIIAGGYVQVIHNRTLRKLHKGVA